MNQLLQLVCLKNFLKRKEIVNFSRQIVDISNILLNSYNSTIGNSKNYVKFVAKDKMKFDKNILQALFIISLIVLAVLSRLVDHPPNFTPLAAIALFGAAYFSNKKWALIVPVLAWWVSDLLLNATIYASYETTFLAGYQLWSFLAIALIAVVGYYMLRKISFKNIIGSAFVAAIIFFLISNFGVWLSGTMYPMNISGLISCYVAGIPFFHWSLLGNIFYLGLMVGVYEWVNVRYLKVA